MAGYFAELNNGIVKRVIVAETKEWCEQALGGTWVQTYYDTPGKNYAGIGFTYHPDVDNFSSPAPFPSWTLQSDLSWQPPVAYPDVPLKGGNETQSTGEIFYQWDEDLLTWVEHIPAWQQSII